MVHDALLRLGYPLREVHEYAEAVRRDAYNIEINSTDEHQSLHEMISATGSIEIRWVTLSDQNPLVGKSLQESNIRAHTGASVVALIRDRHIVANPKSSTEFLGGDRIGLIGEPEQLETALAWLSGLAAVSVQ